MNLWSPVEVHTLILFEEWIAALQIGNSYKLCLRHARDSYRRLSEPLLIAITILNKVAGLIYLISKRLNLRFAFFWNNFFLTSRIRLDFVKISIRNLFGYPQTFDQRVCWGELDSQTTPRSTQFIQVYSDRIMLWTYG